MRKAIHIFICFCISLQLAVPAQAAFTCNRVQSLRPMKPMDRFSALVMKIVGSVVSDPTALRMELKGVVDILAGKERIEDLQKYFGDRFKLRDEAADGEVNITSTMYMNIAKYLSPSGEEKSVKLRFRRYFSQRIVDKFRQAMRPAKGFEDKSMMEIKIQHPFKKNVVIKLRVKVFSQDIPHLTTDSFLTFKEKIRERMLAINKKNPADVDLALEFITELLQNPARREEHIFAHTEYERDSYSMKIPHATIPGKEIEVQITSDINIWLKRLIDMQDFSVYGDDQVIYELKVPNDQAGLSEQDIADYPGLAKIKEFKEWLEANHDYEKEFNRGKINKVDRKKFYLDDGRKEAKEQVYEFLRKLGWIS